MHHPDDTAAVVCVCVPSSALGTPGAVPELKLVDEKDKGTVCQNLTEVTASSPDDVFRLLQAADSRSRTTATRMNKLSKCVTMTGRRVSQAVTLSATPDLSFCAL